MFLTQCTFHDGSFFRFHPALRANIARAPAFTHSAQAFSAAGVSGS